MGAARDGVGLGGTVRVGVAAAVGIIVGVLLRVAVRVGVGLPVGVGLGGDIGGKTIAHPVRASVASMPDGLVVLFVTSTRRQFVPAVVLNAMLVAEPLNPAAGVEPISPPFR